MFVPNILKKSFSKLANEQRYHGNYNQFILYTLAMNPYPCQLCLHPNPQKKPPSRMTALTDLLDDFNDDDKISYFSNIGESLCPSGYKLQVDESRAVFYKLENCKTFDIPTITEAIVIDNDLHVKPFFLAPLYPSLHSLLQKRIAD